MTVQAVSVADRRGPAGAPAAKDFRHSLRVALRTVWRGKFIILSILGMALVPTAVLLEQTVPLYTAEVSVLVLSPTVVSALRDHDVRDSVDDTDTQNEAELIASTVVAGRVVDKLHLDQDPEFNPALRPADTVSGGLPSFNPRAWLSDAIRAVTGSEARTDQAPTPAMRQEMARSGIVRAVLRRLQVQAQRRSNVIFVRYTSESRAKAKLIANTVAETYVFDRLEAGFEEARQVSMWLGERLETLRRDVTTLETAVEEFRAQHGLRRKDERQATVTDQQMSGLNSRLVLARTELLQKQARLDRIHQLVRSHGSLDSASDVLQSPLVQRLREQETAVQRTISDAQSVYGDRHPRVVGMRSELTGIRTAIAGEIERIRGSIANEVEVAAASVRSLERDLGQAQGRDNQAGGAEIRLRDLERQAEASRKLYEDFLARFKFEAGQERMQRANARVVSPADLPVAPSFPHKGSTLFTVAFMATAFGVALVFLLDRLNVTIRSSDQAEEVTGLRVVGLISLQRGVWRRSIEEMLKDTRSALADDLRGLRTSISLDGGEAARVIAITSSVPKEGKSFVSLHLATMFAKADPRVLLIDADLHRPRQHTMIGMEGERGLAQILAGEADFDAVVRRAAVDTLDILPAGRLAQTGEHAGELMRQTVFEELLRDLSGRYDRIIIDTPPVLAVSDSRLLARLADRVVYLIRWNATSRDAVGNGLKLLREAGVEVFGVALSQIDRRKYGRYGYSDYVHYYGRYQKYHGA